MYHNENTETSACDACGDVQCTRQTCTVNIIFPHGRAPDWFQSDCTGRTDSKTPSSTMCSRGGEEGLFESVSPVTFFLMFEHAMCNTQVRLYSLSGANRQRMNGVILTYLLTCVLRTISLSSECATLTSYI